MRRSAAAAMPTTGPKSACAAGGMNRGVRGTQTARVRRHVSRLRVHTRVDVAGPSCSEEPTPPPGVRRFPRVTPQRRAGGTVGAASSPPFPERVKIPEVLTLCRCVAGPNDRLSGCVWTEHRWGCWSNPSGPSSLKVLTLTRTNTLPVKPVICMISSQCFGIN